MKDTTTCLRCGEVALMDGKGKWLWECVHCGFLWVTSDGTQGWQGLKYYSRKFEEVVDVPDGCLGIFNSEAV